MHDNARKVNGFNRHTVTYMFVPQRNAVSYRIGIGSTRYDVVYYAYHHML